MFSGNGEVKETGQSQAMEGHVTYIWTFILNARKELERKKKQGEVYGRNGGRGRGRMTGEEGGGGREGRWLGGRKGGDGWRGGGGEREGG